MKIDVSVNLDDSGAEARARDLESKINAIGKAAAAASKQKFNPVSIDAKKDLEAIEKRLASVLKIQTELARRAKHTDQSGVDALSLNYDKMYHDPTVRARKMREVVQYVSGSQFSGAEQTGRQAKAKPSAFAQAGVNAVQAGLNAASGATGGVTGVASRSLGTGMSSGFGAGMMGLLGGVVALGVGKAVGAIADHVDKAEQDNVDLDRLKRTLGDVNVAFNSLKVAVHSSADRLGLTFEEAGKLSLQYAKQANLSGEKGLHQIPGELATSVGLARSFGLDPSQTGGVLGNMRGLGVTKNETDTRKFALLIGETIGKSDAFAKSDEVMEALSGYMTAQTRATLGGANAEGYAGMFAGLTSSGIPGLDPAGSGSLLSRVNAALTAGGAKGEPSQFFHSRLASARGMDVFDARAWREGGAFATADNTFGGNSALSRFYEKNGLAKPKGKDTLLSANLKQLKQDYANNPKMMLEAAANQLGVGLGHAAALLDIDPKNMGEMSKYGLKDMNASGINLMSQVFSGSAQDRQGIAKEMLARKGKDKLTGSDAEELARVASGGDDSALKSLLADLAAKYGQENTQGSDIRDSKNLLDNIKTNLADKLVPLSQDMREGILYLAGDRKKSGADVLKEIAQKGSENRIAQINGESDTSKLMADRAHLRASMPSEKVLSLKKSLGLISDEEYAKQMAARKPIQNQIGDLDKRISGTRANRDTALQVEKDRLQSEMEKIEGEIKTPVGSAPGGSGKTTPDSFDDLFAKYGKQYGVDPRLLKAIAMKESGMNPNATGAMNRNGTQDFGLMQHNSKYLAERGLTNGEWANPERSVEEAAKLLKKNMAATRGDVRGAVRMYNGSGPRAEAYADDVMSRVGGTQMPEEAKAAAAQQQRQQSVNVTVSPLRVEHVKPDGSMYAPPEQLQTRVSSPGSSFRM